MSETPSRDAPENADGADEAITRRALVAGAVSAGGALALASLAPAAARVAGAQGAAAPPAAGLVAPPDPSKVLGPGTSATSARSPFVRLARTPTGAVTGGSFSPLRELTGSITPTDLHFERHHGGVAVIDPARWKLLVHGLVGRATMFTLDDLRALPAVTRVCFLECAGNGRAGYRKPTPELTVQAIDGMISNAEWTGVPVRTLLAEAGGARDASWMLAEGGDAALLSRSVPMSKMLDDALLVYAQNGEPLRPAAGYPVRLLLPGWEGNMNVKWLRRLEAIRRPNMSRDETSRYTDPLPNDRARQFSFEMDAKSVLTAPTYPDRLVRGRPVQLTGLAWSGRGRITRVEVSTDGGRTWSDAALQGMALPKAAVRFAQSWRWEGEPATLVTRATDETGYVQPTLAEFRRGRGAGTDYHFNFQKRWRVLADGRVLYDAGAS